MNLRLGRFGKQEGACVCGLGALVSGMWTVNTGTAYENGNVGWLATMLGLLGAALVFLLLTGAMEKLGAPSLWPLLKKSVGGFLGSILGSILLALLVLSAALPNVQLLSAMNRYVFEGAEEGQIALYQLVALLLMTLLGMEAVARTGRLLALPGVVSVGLAIFLASPAFGLYHLFPLLGAGMQTLLLQSLQSLLRFLPPVLALSIVGEGCQGRDCLKRSGLVGLLTGGLLAVLMQLALGLSCYSWDIARLPIPLYHMTMATRYDAVTVRLDVTVLFLWVVCALGAGAFYLYAGSYLLCKMAGLGDIRPVGTGLCALAATLGLLLHSGGTYMETLATGIYNWGWALGALPVALTLVGSMVRREKRRGHC